MKKFVVFCICFLLFLAAVPGVVVSGDEEKCLYVEGSLGEESKRFYFCYFELEGVWSDNFKIMYWGFPLLTELFFGGFDDLDSIVHFVFRWNLTFPYRDATISIYRNQGGSLIFEKNDLSEITIFFFRGYYSSEFYYATMKGHAFIVDLV